jgi:hypothetical protein
MVHGNGCFRFEPSSFARQYFTLAVECSRLNDEPLRVKRQPPRVARQCFTLTLECWRLVRECFTLKFVSLRLARQCSRLADEGKTDKFSYRANKNPPKQGDRQPNGSAKPSLLFCCWGYCGFFAALAFKTFL